jgi:hypothetical protein
MAGVTRNEFNMCCSTVERASSTIYDMALLVHKMIHLAELHQEEITSLKRRLDSLDEERPRKRRRVAHS